MKPVVWICLLSPWMLSQPGVTERKRWAGETSDAFPASPSSKAFAETWWITGRGKKGIQMGSNQSSWPHSNSWNQGQHWKTVKPKLKPGQISYSQVDCIHHTHLYSSSNDEANLKFISMRSQDKFTLCINAVKMFSHYVTSRYIYFCRLQHRFLTYNKAFKNQPLIHPNTHTDKMQSAGWSIRNISGLTVFLNFLLSALIIDLITWLSF